MKLQDTQPDADRDDLDEEDGWPLPRASRKDLFDPGLWLRAQADCAFDLAETALAVGRLDARLAAMSPEGRQGAQRRLALIEVEAMLWAQGTPLARHEVGLDLMAARAGTDLAAMAQARWALRRLEGQGSLADLRGFLGLHRAEAHEGAAMPMAARLSGAEFDEAAAGFAENLGRLTGLHPLCRAPVASMLWRLSELSPERAGIEPAVWIARDMAADLPGLDFLPMGRDGRLMAREIGSPLERLGRHLAGLKRGVQDACLLLDRINQWAERARDQTAAIKGSNPARVVAALAAHPLMTTAMVEEASGFSRDTAERLLARMAEMGIVREVTGTRRFRLWSAAI